MRIALIHALKHSIAPIEASFARLWPDVELANLLDDRLSADLARDGALTPAMTDRFLGLGRYAVSTGVAFVIIVIAGYALHCLWTFSEKLSVRGFARYTAAMLLTLPFSLGGMYLLRDVAHWPMWFASPFLTGVMFCWNFVAAHWAVVTQTIGRKKAALDKAPV